MGDRYAELSSAVRQYLDEKFITGDDFDDAYERIMDTVDEVVDEYE